MKKLIPVLGILIAFAFPVFAQTTGSSPSGGTSGSSPSGMAVTSRLVNPLKSDYDTFSKFTAAVIETAVEVMLPFVVLGFIYSGFLFVKAQGKDEALTDAKKAIWWSIVGAFILFGAWGFAQIISTTISTLTK